MTKVPNNPQCNSGLEPALESLRQILADGLQHGFFEVVITCEIAKGRKRQLIIRAGKSFKFIIAEEELSKLNDQFERLLRQER